MRVARRLLPVLLPLLAACSDSGKNQSVAESAAGSQPQSATGQSVPTPPKRADSLVASAKTAAPRRLAPLTDTAAVQDVAAYLGGLPPSRTGKLAPLAAQPAWQVFAADADKSWQKYRLTHTAPMTKWARTELDSVQQVSPLIFYPFSGPDFLNVFTLFSRAETYVMVGLEPVGSIPDQATLQSPDLFRSVKASLWSVLNFSFFRTNDMAVDLKSAQLDGALPLIMLFAARTGNQLIAVRPVQLDADGYLQPADTAQRPNPKSVPGAEIKIRAADGSEKTIYYFSADISDGNLSTHPALLRYLRSAGPLTTYVKSATYLMHKAYFSKIRNLILDRSQYVLQDDSGIAMKYFPKGWQFTYYGTYKRPINLFAKHYQPELTAAYTDSLHRPRPRPLPFGTGYNWRQTDSNLLLARRKQMPAS
ncbi:hypothetical protein [uncultured Hymenobacter sp.]|uniref:hypothetical protein n=1 Tax=uncultured Hymenobacter sp. TaxID=170016 RepID=UPI0035CA5828